MFPIPLSAPSDLIRWNTTVPSNVRIMNSVKSEYCQYSSSVHSSTENSWKTQSGDTSCFLYRSVKAATARCEPRMQCKQGGRGEEVWRRGKGKQGARDTHWVA